MALPFQQWTLRRAQNTKWHSAALFINVCICLMLSSAAENVCCTPECVLAAGRMIRLMNLSADPCEDFREYACGRFIQESVLPQGRSYVDATDGLTDKNNEILKAIITEVPKEGEPMYLTNMKRFYNSCMDEDQIELIGTQPYLSDTEFSNDWPTLNPAWNETTFNLPDVIARYMMVDIQPLFSIYVTTDSKNSTLQALYLNPGSFELPDKLHRNADFVQAYRHFLTNLAVELGASRTEAEKDVRDVVDLEIALTLKYIPNDNKSALYNPIRLADLSTMYPELDIPGALRAAFSTANMSLSDDQIVITQYPEYIETISVVLGNASSRTIQNLFGFKYAVARVDSLTGRLRNISLEYNGAFTGNLADRPRWERCLQLVSHMFWKGMSKKFVEIAFPESAKQYITTMIYNLKRAFKILISHNTWMSAHTRREAMKKLDAMRQKIGYPDVDFTDSDIEATYQNYMMDATTYYANRLLIDRQTAIEKLLLLLKPVDKRTWNIAAFIANAYYAWSFNEIIFTAAFLRPPYFSQTLPDYMNYGAIGVVIGHEITHGFDNKGSQFDADGNLRMWWDPSDTDRFKTMSQCIIDQYNNFHVAQINMSLDGKASQGESLADVGGLKESYRAYTNLRRYRNMQRLPGVNLNPNQLYFLSYAQMYCDKMTPQTWKSVLTMQSHPPAKYRIIGPLQNSQDFARVYRCRRGSYMNPAKKCNVW